MAKEKKQQPRLKEKYEKEIIPALMKDLGIKNRMAVPSIKKISLNVGIGKMSVMNNKIVEQATNNIAKITGQLSMITKSKKSVAGFKLREGMPVGIIVTLRGPRMYEFLDRLVNISLPRVRDFRGLDVKGFDGQGNYSIGIKEYTVFPEIIAESSDILHGLQVNISLKNADRKKGLALLKYFGFPFKS